MAVLRDLVVEIEDEETADPVDGKVANLLAHTAPIARLNRLADAPASTWTALAAANLFRASLANIEVYRATHGGVVDDHLGALLERAGSVHVDEEADTLDGEGNALDRQGAAIAILNASSLSPETRVMLVSSLDAPTPLPVDGINPERSNLFALLLGQGLVEDDEVTFARLRAGGWAALGPALNATNHLHAVLSPGLLEDLVGDALTDSNTSGDVANAIIDSVRGVRAARRSRGLAAVADYAHAHQRALTPQTVSRVARVGDAEGELDVPLVLDLLAAGSPPADAAAIVETFLHLGDPYDLISTTGKKFERPNDDVHEKLLRVLDSEGLVTRGWPRRGGIVSVTVK